MKKKFSTVVLSCLTCISMLVYSALPVYAISQDSCSHPNFALSAGPVPTGEYEYLESGHYQVYGMGYTCLRCGYEYYTDTYPVFESGHNLVKRIFVYLGDGTVEVRYYCDFEGCDWYGVYE